MKDIIPDGVWPTMITPFTETNDIDYNALEQMIEWYIDKGVDGLFAVCQSSEMFSLTLEERVNLAQFVKEKSKNRISVIASGHISNDIEEQLNELKAIADTGVDAVVLVTNRLAQEDESEAVWKKNFEIILSELPEIPLGFYECPNPTKYLLSPELLKWCASSDRVYFLKDTSCNLNSLKEKVNAVSESDLKVFNANAATLLESLKMGVAGYSGVMGNFQPELYRWLIDNWYKCEEDSEKIKNIEVKVERVQNFLGFSSVIEHQCYPINAKYFLQLEGFDLNLNSRVKDVSEFKSSFKVEIEQFREFSQEIHCNL